MTDEALDGALAIISDAGPRASDPGRTAVVSDRSALTDYDNQLIADLVANLRPADAILRHYGLTKEDIAAKSRNPEWAARYRQIEQQWNSDQNLRERIRAKAAFLLEDSLVPLMKIISGQASHASKLEAIEKLIKISTVAHVPKDEGHQTEARRIILNIGAGVGPITVVSESQNERTAVGILPAQAPGN
jgi:hypothetical protein